VKNINHSANHSTNYSTILISSPSSHSTIYFVILKKYFFGPLRGSNSSHRQRQLAIHHQSSIVSLWLTSSPMDTEGGHPFKSFLSIVSLRLTFITNGHRRWTSIHSFTSIHYGSLRSQDSIVSQRLTSSPMDTAGGHQFIHSLPFTTVRFAHKILSTAVRSAHKNLMSASG
jgi:hypothetical protein